MPHAIIRTLLLFSGWLSQVIFLDRGSNHVPCARRRIPIHGTTREVQHLEVAHVQQRRPTTTKINKSLKKWPYICASGGKKYNIQFGKNVQK